MIRFKHVNLALASTLAFLMMLTACANPQIETIVVTEIVTPTQVDEPPDSFIGPPEPTGDPTLDTLIVCVSQEPDTLYGLASVMNVTTTILLAVDPRGQYNDRAYGYETQMLVDKQFPTLENGGAEFLDDGRLSVTFRFNPQIAWSDGEPFTVDDILFTYGVMLDPDSGATSRTDLESFDLEKIDDHTLRLTYKQGILSPFYSLPPLTSESFLSAPLPEHVLGDMTPAEILESDYARLPDPVLGPYRFVEWIEGERVELEAVPNWWGGEASTPNLIFRFITDSNQLLASTFSGNCDYASSDGLQLTQLPFIQRSADQDLIQFDAIAGTLWEKLDFNMAPPSGSGQLPFFADLRARQAVAYGTNRLSMTEDILFGEVDVLNSYLPSDHWAWNPATEDAYPYDPDQARALLTEIGWELGEDNVLFAPEEIRGEYSCGRGEWVIPAGTRFEISFGSTSGNTLREQTSTLLQADMAEIGIDLRIDLLPSSVWFGADGPLNTRSFQIGQYASRAGTDPGALFRFAGQNVYRTPEGEFRVADTLPDTYADQLAALAIPANWSAGVYPDDLSTFLRFGRPDNLPEGFELVYSEQIPDGYDGGEGSNRSGWCDPRATQLLWDGSNQLSDADRLPIYYEFQELYVEQLPSLTLFQRVNIHVYSRYLCGVENGPVNFPTWNIESWYLTSEGEC
ncbi:MAG: peptide ABC transporter substrate-binding protein [Chloroflexi bacterium]|nr:peptide ABC transporter substrate-binding protein [Chloroflexota bacterium]